MCRDMPVAPYNVLFLCGGNSARSIISEALLNKIGASKFQAYSAGSHPKGNLNPHALILLQGLGFDTTKLRSKSWHEFTKPDAPKFDFIFTLCDRVAGEQCPAWPGHPITAHWGVPDPEPATGRASVVAEIFNYTCRMLAQRISVFVALPIDKLDVVALQSRLHEISRVDSSRSR
jgi:arsenate reductase